MDERVIREVIERTVEANKRRIDNLKTIDRRGLVREVTRKVHKQMKPYSKLYMDDAGNIGRSSFYKRSWDSFYLSGASQRTYKSKIIQKKLKQILSKMSSISSRGENNSDEARSKTKEERYITIDKCVVEMAIPSIFEVDLDISEVITGTNFKCVAIQHQNDKDLKGEIYTFELDSKESQGYSGPYANKVTSGKIEVLFRAFERVFQQTGFNISVDIKMTDDTHYKYACN